MFKNDQQVCNFLPPPAKVFHSRTVYHPHVLQDDCDVILTIPRWSSQYLRLVKDALKCVYFS